MHIVRTFVLHEIYIKKICIITDFGNSVEVTLKYYFRNITHVGLNENCFIRHLVV